MQAREAWLLKDTCCGHSPACSGGSGRGCDMMLKRVGVHLMSHCNQFGSHKQIFDKKHLIVVAVVSG